MIDLSRGCARFRPVLVDFVDRGDVAPETGAALAHLDRCPRCTKAIESTMLTITALRRIGDEAAALAEEPAAEAWPRLRVRIESLRRRPVVMSPLTGIAMSFALVAVLVLPVRFGGSLVGPIATPRPDSAAATSFIDRRIEAAYIAAVRQGSLLAAENPGAVAPTAGSYPRIYPDNYRPTRKEVGGAEPTGRPPEAI
ncbi:MAG: zf-HC2 domain-containing protein [Chloroflexi bacterium]|nr:zf-HC2 domain-containing protein [Chloroflexota bacterium]